MTTDRSRQGAPQARNPAWPSQRSPSCSACLRSGERLVGVDVRALEGEEELPVNPSQRSLEHLHQFAPRRFGEPHAPTGSSLAARERARRQ